MVRYLETRVFWSKLLIFHTCKWQFYLKFRSLVFQVFQDHYIDSKYQKKLSRKAADQAFPNSNKIYIYYLKNKIYKIYITYLEFQSPA